MLPSPVADDCPYPDIPTYGAHCEDASPFMCKNEKFRQKCCQSCNKGNTFIHVHILYAHSINGIRKQEVRNGQIDLEFD